MDQGHFLGVSEAGTREHTSEGASGEPYSRIIRATSTGNRSSRATRGASHQASPEVSRIAQSPAQTLFGPDAHLIGDGPEIGAPHIGSCADELVPF
jgi:hypothetical protein